MKKLITILAIMIVLVGAVFAADSASQSLTVTAEIAEKIPTFAMKGGIASGTYSATATADTHPDAQEYTYSKVALTGDIVTTDLVAYFQVLQTADANLSKVYNFSVTAGKFVRQGKKVTENNTTTIVDDGRSYTIDKAVTISAATKNATTDAMTYIAINDTNSTNGSFSATYSGSVAGTALELATFNVTWTHDPAAIDGSYAADVTLTVETV